MYDLYQKLKSFGQVKTNAPLSKYTTFRVGGPAKFLVVVDDGDKLVGLLNFLSENGEDFFVLGGGSNLLMPDDGLDVVVVKIATGKLETTGNEIIADAGVLLAKVMMTATQNSLTGIEWAAGIPGTVGGAVRGNAGAMGKDTGGNIAEVEVWENGEVVKYDIAECGFGYRDSIFKRNAGKIILRARFRLEKGDPQKIIAQVQEYISYRHTRFPIFASAGSFFKNFPLDEYKGDRSILPEKFLQLNKIGAAWFVEQAGMKGYASGGAKVADEHANFIVNASGDATQADILTVVEVVREAVYNKYGVELTPEVEIVK